MNSAERRRYTSPLRAEQAAATRGRILDAAIALLQEDRSGEVAMPDVAARAGVSVSTAYRAFATREDLLLGVLEELKDRFEIVAGPRPTTVDELVESVRRAVPAVLEVEDLYRALFAIPEGRELHRSTAPQRSSSIDEMLRNELAGLEPALTPAQARRFVAALHLVSSSRAVLFLKDYEGLDAADASATLQWVMGVLVGAIRDPARRTELEE
jgi:AcrR family transcriptional regulator